MKNPQGSRIFLGCEERKKHDEAGVFYIDVFSKSTHREGTAEK